MSLERNTLMEEVYPKIKEYCKERHGLEFQGIFNTIFYTIHSLILFRQIIRCYVIYSLSILVYKFFDSLYKSNFADLIYLTLRKVLNLDLSVGSIVRYNLIKIHYC